MIPKDKGKDIMGIMLTLQDVDPLTEAHVALGAGACPDPSINHVGELQVEVQSRVEEDRNQDRDPGEIAEGIILLEEVNI
jgi:hypothetical protein